MVWFGVEGGHGFRFQLLFPRRYLYRFVLRHDIRLICCVFERGGRGNVRAEMDRRARREEVFWTSFSKSQLTAQLQRRRSGSGGQKRP